MVAVLSLASDAGAQLRYGFRFGGVFSRPSLSGVPTPDSQTNKGDAIRLKKGSGFSGGLMLEYQFEKCGFAPDIALLYTRYSNTFSGPLTADLEVQGPGKNFLEVPLHLKYKFWLSSTKKLVAPMVYTGPSFLFGLDKNTTGLPDRKRFDAGWDVGVGIDIINFIQLQAGYRFGLTNAAATAPASGSIGAAPDLKLHLNGWTVAANIIFDF